MSEIETITPPGNAAADLPLMADVLPQDDPTAKPAKPAKAPKAPKAAKGKAAPAPGAAPAPAPTP